MQRLSVPDDRDLGDGMGSGPVHRDTGGGAEADTEEHAGHVF